MMIEVWTTNKSGRYKRHGWHPATRKEAELWIINHEYGNPLSIKRDFPRTTLTYDGFLVDIDVIDEPTQDLLF
jgi:hypothetical protein